MNRYQSGDEVFAIEHDESSNQYTEYNDDDKITEAEAELEASNSPTKSTMKELSQGLRPPEQRRMSNQLGKNGDLIHL